MVIGKKAKTCKNMRKQHQQIFNLVTWSDDLNFYPTKNSLTILRTYMHVHKVPSPDKVEYTRGEEDVLHASFTYLRNRRTQ